MEIIAAGLFILLLFVFVIYDYLEISALKYGVLKALASQSKAVDSALQKLLKTKNDYKILNKEFKKIENIYLTSLNDYLIQFMPADHKTVRREILKKNHFEL